MRTTPGRPGSANQRRGAPVSGDRPAVAPRAPSACWFSTTVIGLPPDRAAGVEVEEVEKPRGHHELNAISLARPALPADAGDERVAVALRLLLQSGDAPGLARP